MKRDLLCVLTVILALAFAVLSVGATVLEEERQIYDLALRLHIPANSDSEEDQAVKLKVRNAVLEVLDEPLRNCQTRDKAAQIVQSLTDVISLTANNVLYANGMDYTASVSLGEEYYPTRDYEGISLPAGKYLSLKIELGKAEGKNWWCVLFPQVCVGCARPAEAMAQVGFTPNQIKLLTEQEDGGYTVKFKLLEIIEGIFG